jgi:hypothetical protein
MLDMQFEEMDLPKKPPSRGLPYKPLWLLYPIWGTVLTAAMSCLVKSSGDFFLFVGCLGLLPSVAIILGSSENHFLIRLVLLFAYTICSVFVIFILGWGAICWFCPSCH